MNNIEMRGLKPKLKCEIAEASYMENLKLEPGKISVTELLATSRNVNSLASQRKLVFSHNFSQKDRNTLRGTLSIFNQKIITEVFQRLLSCKELLQLLRKKLEISEKFPVSLVKAHVLNALKDQSTCQLGKETTWKAIVGIFNRMLFYYNIPHECKGMTLREFSRMLVEPLEITMTNEDCQSLFRERLISDKSGDSVFESAQIEMPNLASRMLCLFDMEEIEANLPSMNRVSTTTLDQSLFSKEQSSNRTLVYDSLYDQLSYVEKNELKILTHSRPGLLTSMNAMEKLVHVLTDPSAMEQEITTFEQLFDLLQNLERIFGLYPLKEEILKKVLLSLDQVSIKMARQEINRAPLLQRVLCEKTAIYQKYEQVLRRLAGASEQLLFSEWLNGELKEIIKDKAVALYENYLEGVRKLAIHHISISTRDFLIWVRKNHFKDKSISEHQTFFQAEFLQLLASFSIDIPEIIEVFERKKRELEGPIAEWQKSYTEKRADAIVGKFQDKIRPTSAEESFSFKVGFMIDLLSPIYTNVVRLREYQKILESMPLEQQNALQVVKVHKILYAIERIYGAYTKDLDPAFVKALEYRVIVQSIRQSKDLSKAIQSLPKDLFERMVDFLVAADEKKREDVLLEIEQNPKMILTAKNQQGDLLLGEMERVYHVTDNRSFTSDELDEVMKKWASNLQEGLSVIEDAGAELIAEGVIGSDDLRKDPNYMEQSGLLEKTTPNFKVYYDPFTISFQLVTSRLWMPVESYMKMIGKNHENYAGILEVLKTLKRLTETANLFL